MAKKKTSDYPAAVMTRMQDLGSADLTEANSSDVTFKELYFVSDKENLKGDKIWKTVW